MSFNSVQDPEVDALAQQLASLKRVTKTEAADGAIEAFARFGKGRYPAGLNFGNCFAYACARACRMPLLFKGNDLPLTDITAT